MDRILKQQKAERDAAEEARREKEKEFEKLLSDSQPNMPGGMAPVIPTSTRPIPTERISLEKGQTPDEKRPVSPELPVLPESEVLLDGGGKKGHRPASALANSLQMWKRKLIKNDTHPEAGSSRPTSGEGNVVPDESPAGQKALSNENGTSRQRPPQAGVTPLSNIGT